MPTFKVFPIKRTAIKPVKGDRFTPKGYSIKMSAEGKIFGIVTVERLPQPKAKTKERICIFSDKLHENIEALHQKGIALENMIIDTTEREYEGKTYIDFEITF